MKNYQRLLGDVLLFGNETLDRTGVGTISHFGTNLSFDLQKGFPAVTTKTLQWKGVVAELLWFLSGSTNVHTLSKIQFNNPDKPNIWTANYKKQGRALGYSEGELGPIYGAQFHHNSQLHNFIHRIKEDPTSRRHIISLWNTDDLPKMTLPPCHGLVIQAHVQSGRLNMQWYQRSVDSVLGLPYNIASYALFTHIVAELCGLLPGTLFFCGGDTHIYSNHLEQVNTIITREVRKLPTLIMPEFTSISQACSKPVGDFKLEGYDPHPAIYAPMAV